MSRPPRIGITTYHRSPRSGAVRLPGEYADCVRRAGGLPLLLQPGETRVGELLAALDGVLLTGGGDVDPALWAERPDEVPAVGTSRERDASEMALIRAAVEAGVPALCVCRGQQLLNVAFGGTLVGDIEREVGREIEHRSASGDPVLHEVEVGAGTLLSQVLGEASVTGSSWHHQAVARSGRGLRVTARAADGVIEGLELEAGGDLLAVQWHPELTAEDDQVQRRLFDWLVERADG